MTTKTCCSFHSIGGPEELDCDIVDPSDLTASYDVSTVTEWRAYGNPNEEVAARYFRSSDICPVIDD